MYRPYNNSTVGLLPSPHLFIRAGWSYHSFQVYFKTNWYRLLYSRFIESYLAQLVPSSSYVICPGIRYWLLSVFRYKIWWSGMNPFIGVCLPTELNGMFRKMSSRLKEAVVLTAVNHVSSLFISFKRIIWGLQPLLIWIVSLQALQSEEAKLEEWKHYMKVKEIPMWC